ncbi:collectin-11 [Plakobranchus ocellatus]|uniref:Collectin-11 n=1 Tax=Plakobranchus ocellatus TaxID=259542 RepID=A0AAV4BAT2_9GAST|nr:collectin-11 [Plakobranchus ocellatus]
MFVLAIFATFPLCAVPIYARTAAVTCPSGNPEGSKQFVKPFKGKCFKFYAQPDSKKQYWEAQKECEKNKGNLAMPKTKEVNQFLVESLLEYDMTEEVFIGLDDMDKEDNFKWKDGSELMKPKFYQNFATGTGIFRQRGGQSKDCVTLDPVSNTWRDIECRRNILQRLTGYKKKERSFVCEAENRDNNESGPDSDATGSSENGEKTGGDSSAGDSAGNKSAKKDKNYNPLSNDKHKQDKHNASNSFKHCKDEQDNFKEDQDFDSPLDGDDEQDNFKGVQDFDSPIDGDGDVQNHPIDDDKSPANDWDEIYDRKGSCIDWNQDADDGDESAPVDWDEFYDGRINPFNWKDDDDDDDDNDKTPPIDWDEIYNGPKGFPIDWSQDDDAGSVDWE